jgi:hypothetical protein
VAPHIPAAKLGGRPRTTDVRAVFDAILYLLRTGCQWRQLASDFPPWPTVHGYFRDWRTAGIGVVSPFVTGLAKVGNPPTLAVGSCRENDRSRVESGTARTRGGAPSAAKAANPPNSDAAPTN